MAIKKLKLKKKPAPKKISTNSILNKLKAGYKNYHYKKTSDKEGLSLADAQARFILPAPGYAYPYPANTQKQEQDEEAETTHAEGMEMPVGTRVLRAPIIHEDKESLKTYNKYYNLIPRKPQKGESVFAYANIKWDSATYMLVYNVIELPLSPSDMEILDDVKKHLEERLDIDFSKLGAIQSKEILRKQIEDIIFEMSDINPGKMPIISYYLENKIIGLGRIEALMNDPNIEDISCDGVGVPIYVYHRDSQLASLRTNIVFDSADELNNFVVKLAQKCNKTISIADPLLDGSLPDGSRVQATLGTDIAKKGSNFTIRKFTEMPLTPVHMIKYGTLNALQLAYLWMAVENGKSILISGGTATGKTSLLNALSLFINPTAKVVSIEDTAELRLPHPHWISEVARTPLSIKGNVGEVTLFDLLKSSLRQRPDYIVLGEVRGKEAYVLFQQMATGHPSLATIHAASISQLIDRLITPPISLPPTLLENINIIIFLLTSRHKGSYIRRANTIQEVIGVRNQRPVTRKIFEWNSATDSFEIIKKSVVLNDLAKRQGLKEDEIKEEVIRRKMILEWMVEQDIYDYREVSKVIDTYYSTPERLVDIISAR